MLNHTQVQFTNRGSTSYINATFTIYNQTTHLVLYNGTRMENVLFLVESSTQAKTNILLALIMPKPISIFHECKVIVIMIYFCVFIHKINS